MAAQPMLEDEYADVIRKACVGCGISQQQLSQRLGVSETDWQSFLAGDFDVQLAKRIAETLKLKPEAFAKLPIYQPKPLAVSAITQLELPFGHWSVNCWWVEQGSTRLLFDAGMGPDDVVEAMPAKPHDLFITHGHHDHVGGVEALIGKGVSVHGAEFSGSRQVELCGEMDFGDLKLKVCDLSGHYVPAVGYHIEGLEVPVLVVGDALFAGSIGKTPNPERYRLALHTLREALVDLPEDAVLLPGHGPATTVGEERENNPFI
jgi:hydroxyacylglutathione hydrolase